MGSEWISKHRLIWLCAMMLVCVSLDQGTKSWAQDALATPEHLVGESGLVFVPSLKIEVVPNTLNFIYRENPAAAFSLTRSFPDWFRRPFLVLFSVLASFFFLAWYFRIKTKDGMLLTAFCSILAGAVGNLIDRLTFGYVIDFIDLYAGFLGYPDAHWPTFNIADSLIVVGALMVLWRSTKSSA